MAIIAYKDHTSETISKIFKISQRHFLKIVHDYQAFGIEGLIQHPRGHNASKLNESPVRRNKTVDIGKVKRAKVGKFIGLY